MTAARTSITPGRSGTGDRMRHAATVLLLSRVTGQDVLGPDGRVIGRLADLTADLVEESGPHLVDRVVVRRGSRLVPAGPVGRGGQPRTQPAGAGRRRRRHRALRRRQRHRGARRARDHAGARRAGHPDRRRRRNPAGPRRRRGAGPHRRGPARVARRGGGLRRGAAPAATARAGPIRRGHRRVVGSAPDLRAGPRRPARHAALGGAPPQRPRAGRVGQPGGHRVGHRDPGRDRTRRGRRGRPCRPSVGR